MTERHFHMSLTRISDLALAPYEIRELDRDDWATADHALVEVLSRSSERPVEPTTGRTIEVAERDVLIGTLGHRFATDGGERVGSAPALPGS